LAGLPITTSALSSLVMSTPHGREQVADAGWQSRSLLFQYLREAERRADTPEACESVQRLADHFLLHYANLSDKTRSVVDASGTSLRDMFNRQPMRRLLCAEKPSFDMSMIQRGTIAIADYPALVHREAGRLTQMVYKLCLQYVQQRCDLRTSPRP